ncbi:MAG: Na/Pi cotransporter family protein [Clostridia bacterium]|nr:Na/Pi cotransporter family protein [Clostridia bacterium]
MTIYDVLSLLGGVGLFLFGMSIMSSGLKNACGENLQLILEKATTNRVIAIFVGVAMTMLIQSSSATDVMVIGFVNAGLMNLAQAIGVIMGANIGTTITAQITAFNISTFTPMFIFTGVIMYMFMKGNMVKYVGEVIMGFGMLFQGISIMKAAIAPLSQSEMFISFITGLDNPLLAVLFGVLFTAILQSSSSSTVIFQTFAVQGLLEYRTAVYLVIGAAIGSVMPNLLASLTTNRNGKRTAILNLLFNLIRAVIILAVIGAFPAVLDLIQSMSPDDVARQIANTHTIFAIFAVIVEFPFVGQIIKLSEKLIPVMEEENEQLHDRSLQFMTNISNVPPAMAMAQAHREVSRMGRIAQKNFNRALDCFFNYDEHKAESVRRREENINALNHSIMDAMADLRSFDLGGPSLKRISQLTMASTDMERLSDHAENIIEYIEEMRSKKARMTETAWEELRRMANDTREALDRGLTIFEAEDYSGISLLDEIEHRIDEQENELIHNHIERLMHSSCEPVSGVIFTDMVMALERCGDHAVNIAYALKEHPSDGHFAEQG